jgi:signal transduction histidine kinase
LSGRSLEETVSIVSRLQSGSIVILSMFTFDSLGQHLPSDGIRQLIEQTSAVPVYGLVGRDLGHGLVGGPVPAFEERFLLASDMAARILHGENPANIPVRTALPKHSMAFDWRQLDRWGIDKRRLPAGSLILFRPPSLWDEHRWLITGISAALLLQLALIIGLSLQRRGRRLTEEALEASRKATEALTGKLLVAHEEERKRIARELHDDFGQQLAAIGFQLSALKYDAPGRSQDEQILPQLQNSLRSLASEIRNTAHQLHPRTFEVLGLAPSLARLADDLSQRTQVGVEFTNQCDGQVAASDAALCLYRVAQEALRNIEQHSGAKHAKMMLRCKSGSLELIIEDGGKGFDLDAARHAGALGLTSMVERVRLVGGNLQIESRAGAGTRITAQIPIDDSGAKSNGDADVVCDSVSGAG